MFPMQFSFFFFKRSVLCFFRSFYFVLVTRCVVWWKIVVGVSLGDDFWCFGNGFETMSNRVSGIDD